MSTKPMTVHGIDISHHQSSKIDWAMAKARGLQWIYHKATEGNSYTDPNYARRRDECKRAGIPFGAYHFARPEKNDAKSEARRFIAVARPLSGDLRPALDLEVDDGMTLGQIRAWAKAFIAEVRRLTGVLPVVYTPYDLGNVTDDCVLWRPRYNDTNTPPPLRWDIWQFSNGVEGVPDFFPVFGLGHVDLNTHREGFRVRDLLIPRAVEEKETLTLHLMHASLQFNDSPRQQEQDVEAIFDRAAQRKVAAVMGTEAGDREFRLTLEDVAMDHGYRFWSASGTDSWYAVHSSLIVPGTFQVWYGEQVIPGQARRHTAKKASSVSFETHSLGTVSLLTSHYLTKGRPGADNPEYRQNVDENRALARAIGERAKVLGVGKGLAFYTGDQNIVDRTEDTFFGAPLTSAWDELEKWDNTGHGNIDVIASFNADGRVSAAYCRALDDKEFPLHADHFLVEAGYDVVLLDR